MANPLIELKIVSAVAVSVVLRDADPVRIDSQLAEKTGSGSLFEMDMCVLDVAHLEAHKKLPWARYRDVLKKHGLMAVAVRNATPDALPSILSAGLAVDAAPGSAISASAISDKNGAGEQVLAHAHPPMIVDSPVRAGQQIYARGCDLIVTQIVNNGAEIIADGNIHVYAPLRGRALAGAAGNPEARIFTLSMEAELVSVGGIYKNFEAGLPPDLRRKACVVSLTDEVLNVRPLSAV